MWNSFNSFVNPEPWERAAISMEFNIPMFTSGLSVRYFHVVEKSNYKPMKWIRYVVKAGDFQFRYNSKLKKVWKSKFNKI